LAISITTTRYINATRKGNANRQSAEYIPSLKKESPAIPNPQRHVKTSRIIVLNLNIVDFLRKTEMKEEKSKAEG